MQRSRGMVAPQSRRRLPHISRTSPSVRHAPIPASLQAPIALWTHHQSNLSQELFKWVAANNAIQTDAVSRLRLLERQCIWNLMLRCAPCRPAFLYPMRPLCTTLAWPSSVVYIIVGYKCCNVIDSYSWVQNEHDLHTSCFAITHVIVVP